MLLSLALALSVASYLHLVMRVISRIEPTVLYIVRYFYYVPVLLLICSRNLMIWSQYWGPLILNFYHQSILMRT